MTTLFADTSAWLASVDPRQAQHGAAAEARVSLADAGADFVTTNLVLAELHAMLTRELGRRPSLRFLDDVYSDPRYAVTHVDRELEAAAVDRWLRTFRDQDFSICDAVSFEVMRREGITRAFTLDRYFAVAGFEMVPGPLPQPKRRR